ncbi:hypothetical protein Tco_0951619 [Tanacetum coccineum]|uniref:Uncharacterized protein n=1 Tax=Tanacetum coccineum TaxID=301880 RepID=A0ABQ5DVK2_9ASTR
MTSCPIPAESDSSPRVHAQTIKTYYKHRVLSIKKAQDLKTKTSAKSDIKDNTSETKLRGRLLESFQEDAKQAYLVGMDTESDPFEDPVETEAPESPYTVAPPTSLPDSTPPILVPILCRTARMAVRVPPEMSSSLSVCIAEVAAMSDLVFRTSELEEDKEEEEEDEEEDNEDEEIEECSDSDSESEDVEDKGPTAEDDDLAARDEGLAAGDEGPRLGYGALRHREIALGEGRMPSVFKVDLEDDITYIHVPAYLTPAPPVQTSPLPEWSCGSLPVSSVPSIIPSPISSPMIPLTVPSLVASPAMTETKGFLTEYDRDIGELFTRSGVVEDEIFSQRYRFRSQTDAHITALWHAISDTQRKNQELRLQIAEKRRARMDLAGIIDSIRIGQEPRGDV